MWLATANRSRVSICVTNISCHGHACGRPWLCHTVWVYVGGTRIRGSCGLGIHDPLPLYYTVWAYVGGTRSWGLLESWDMDRTHMDPLKHVPLAMYYTVWAYVGGTKSWGLLESWDMDRTYMYPLKHVPLPMYYTVWAYVGGIIRRGLLESWDMDRSYMDPLKHFPLPVYYTVWVYIGGTRIWGCCSLGIWLERTLTRWNTQFSRWSWSSIEAKDDGSGGDNWISLAKLQSNHYHQQTNIQFLCRLDALPVAQPTVSKHWREIYHIPWTCLPQAHLGVDLRLWPLIARGYLGAGCHASRQPSDTIIPGQTERQTDTTGKTISRSTCRGWLHLTQTRRASYKIHSYIHYTHNAIPDTWALGWYHSYNLPRRVRSWTGAL